MPQRFFLLQLAAARDIRVIAFGQERSHEVMRAHGAAARVDYRSPDDITTAFDLAGGSIDSIAELVRGPHRSPGSAAPSPRRGHCGYRPARPGDRQRHGRRHIWDRAEVTVDIVGEPGRARDLAEPPHNPSGSRLGS